MRLYVPLKARLGRCLRVLIYARYSTDEQSKHSISAQIAKCRKFLAQWGITDAEIEVISDPGVSGEIVHRTGIDRVVAGIKLRKWDLILAEDSSRLYRNLSACLDLVGGAVDLGIRVILPGDDVDTANDNWMGLLEEAQVHHTRSNAYTRRRIKRTIEELWEMGAAVGPLRAGFKRRASVPATAKEPARGPFFDEVDEKWVSVIHEIFERIARDESPWCVAEWVTSTGMAKASNARIATWRDRNITDLVRNPVYRGMEEYRKKRYQKIHNSQAHNAGKCKAIPNEPENVMTRRVKPMVEDDLWIRANSAIDGRNVNPDSPRGFDHPQAGIPRDSRGPLSKDFCCYACSKKMHNQGRADGGYRCSQAKSGACWNRATADEALTHAAIGKVMAEEILSGQGVLGAYLRHLKEVFQDDEPRRQRMDELRRELKNETETRERVIDKLVGDNADSPGLEERLTQVEQGLRAKNAELASLEAQGDHEQKLPSDEELQAQLEASAATLLSMEREASRLLKRLLDGPILAIPYQQFGSDKVVLRAQIRIKIAGLLPDDLYLLLQSLKVPMPDYGQEVHTVLIDLFEPTSVPKHAKAAWDMLSAGKRRKQIQAALGITKRIACQAVQLGEQMAQAGLVDPYIRLTEPPANASRWRKRNGKSQAGDAPSQEPDTA